MCAECKAELLVQLQGGFECVDEPRCSQRCKDGRERGREKRRSSLFSARITYKQTGGIKIACGMGFNNVLNQTGFQEPT